MGLENVGDLALHVVLSKLGPKGTALVSCVNKRFKITASEDCLWSKFCSQDLDLHAPLDPNGNLAPSFKVLILFYFMCRNNAFLLTAPFPFSSQAVYQMWREAFGMYPWPLVKRVKRCWDGLKNWLTINFPEAKATLRRGASEAELQELENVLKVKLPIPTRILYRFCDGQESMGNDFDSVVGSSLGIIGGYSFYDHLTNVYLLPLSQIIQYTKEITRQLSFPSRSKYILVAASSTSNDKYFFLSCADGQLYVGTRNLVLVEMIPCVPIALISFGNGVNSAQQQDGMLLWLEEHGRRLQNGIIKLHEDKIRSINLFPEEPPLCCSAVTNGVKGWGFLLVLLEAEWGVPFGEVRASAVFIPELADLQDDSERYLFAYSIRMSLLPEGCILNGMTFSSCQLQWRHWIICANNVVVSDTNGEAVIGQFPLLLPGEKEFVYQSYTPLQATTGSVKGSFTFVPGRSGFSDQDHLDLQLVSTAQAQDGDQELEGPG
ncbi:hypothetical protein EZV62_001372 [Acer yangbiense]|uniref:ApaG domain-containing protein n=1 Tax=Acer yangbiense TaxID=1000413 RepID=A0A5C7ITR6_9ROSI|nr:hypothetical protein EZV62_001372 [Acer yangbiense]